jgi:hypothetical protein
MHKHLQLRYAWQWGYPGVVPVITDPRSIDGVSPLFAVPLLMSPDPATRHYMLLTDRSCVIIHPAQL